MMYDIMLLIILILNFNILPVFRFWKKIVRSLCLEIFILKIIILHTIYPIKTIYQYIGSIMVWFIAIFHTE